MIAQVASVDRLILFGSRAQGNAQPRSDIDLAVAISNDKEWWGLQEAVENFPTLLKIDLVRLGDSDDDFTREILATGKVLYERS